MKTLARLLPALFLIAAAETTIATEKRPMVAEDYYRFTFVSSPQIAPDESEVVFVAARVSDDRRGRESSLWLVSTNGDGEPRRLTSGQKDSHPRWSPDGSRIAFLRPVASSDKDDAKKASQIFTLRRDGGEAQPLTAIEGGVSAFTWSPDGKRLLIERRTEPPSETDGEPSSNDKSDQDEEGEEGETDDQDEEDPEPDVRVIRDTKYKRDGRGYLDTKRNHFWLFHIESESLRQLTDGADWTDSNPAFSPDGKQLAFDADHSGDEFDGGSNDDLWILEIDSSQPADETATASEAELPKLQQLTEHPHSDTSPSWSPDGQWIAYLHTDGPFEQTDVLLRPATGGEPRNLTPDFDRHPSSLRWSTDGRTLFFIASDRGARRLFALDVDSGRTRRVLDDDVSVGHLEISPRGNLLTFTLQDEQHLPEVWVSRTDGQGARPLTQLNAELLSELALGRLEPLEFTNEAGMTVQGFVLAPVGLQAGSTYPLVLNIKGGPGGMWGHLWFHEFQMLAGKGWGVAFVNYRGSNGYGDAHQKAVRLDYGGADYRDNMQFLDAVLERYSWIDRERLFVTGGSHGGFLTNWIITQTDRFRAAVTQRSVSSWISEAGTQQYTPRQMRNEFGGTLWDNFDLYWDRSPLKYADRIKTPTLILHSDEDHICPIGQAQEFFYALKAHGVETELVIFRGEGHGLSRRGTPINLVERLRRIIDWFERHL
ncbi:MAG: S9 family peptidase [Acidobacteriota bacterium]